jgi:hypothetical protein
MIGVYTLRAVVGVGNRLPARPFVVEPARSTILGRERSRNAREPACPDEYVINR